MDTNKHEFFIPRTSGLWLPWVSIRG